MRKLDRYVYGHAFFTLNTISNIRYRAKIIITCGGDVYFRNFIGKSDFNKISKFMTTLLFFLENGDGTVR